MFDEVLALEREEKWGVGVRDDAVEKVASDAIVQGIGGRDDAVEKVASDAVVQEDIEVAHKGEVDQVAKAEADPDDVTMGGVDAVVNGQDLAAAARVIEDGNGEDMKDQGGETKASESGGGSSASFAS